MNILRLQPLHKEKDFSNILTLCNLHDCATVTSRWGCAQKLSPSVQFCDRGPQVHDTTFKTGTTG